MAENVHRHHGSSDGCILEILGRIPGIRSTRAIYSHVARRSIAQSHPGLV